MIRLRLFQYLCLFALLAWMPTMLIAAADGDQLLLGVGLLCTGTCGTLMLIATDMDRTR